LTTIDFIKRFTPTPFAATFALPATSIRVETNCRAVVDRLLNVFAPADLNDSDRPGFVWRIVAESENDLEPVAESSSVHGLSYAGLSYISLGQKSFLACDRQARRGLSFISQNVVADEKLFSQCFLPALISLMNESEKESIKAH
jgi:hypothetical protein